MTRTSNLLVFTTTYNELPNIGRLVDQIAKFLPAADILILDDNSPDGTWEVLRSKAAQYPQLRIIQRSGKLGIGSAHKYALVHAIRNGYETLITMDADFSHQPEMLPTLLEAHGTNVFVTGSRYCVGGSSDYAGYRNIVSRAGNVVARVLLGIKLKELTTYFRVFDVASLRKLPLRHINAAGYSFGVQLVFYLQSAGVTLREVPIHFQDRTHGASKIPKLQIFISALDVFKLALYRLSRKPDLAPDLLVEDPCAYCSAPALAMTNRKQSGESPAIYVCLHCMQEQVPAGIATPGA